MNTFTLFIILFWNRLWKAYIWWELKLYTNCIGEIMYTIWNYSRKRKRYDSVLWQKTLPPQKNPKKQRDNIKTQRKTSI